MPSTATPTNQNTLPFRPMHSALDLKNGITKDYSPDELCTATIRMSKVAKRQKLQVRCKFKPENLETAKAGVSIRPRILLVEQVSMSMRSSDAAPIRLLVIFPGGSLVRINYCVFSSMFKLFLGVMGIKRQLNNRRKRLFWVFGRLW